MKSVGIVGQRGMVGSVLMARMGREEDFKRFNPYFFSTSQAGEEGPSYGGHPSRPLEDAYDPDSLSSMDIILTCQGGDYTKKIHPQLRSRGWKGYWIDAASALRMNEDSIIVLDPVNKSLIERGIDANILDYIGGNCTVSLMLMALGGLLCRNKVEWISSQTYQAASGGGARHMRELIAQMGLIGSSLAELNNNSQSNILDIDQECTRLLRSNDIDCSCFGAPLAGNLIPWIDSAMENGQTREEWKGMSEGNKILGLKKKEELIPIDGTCVRIGSLRCHSQAYTIKLKEDLPLDEISALIKNHNQWVKVVPNDPEETRKQLSPVAVSGTLDIAIGRIRKMNMGGAYLNAFSVGDQLLWGAAEPLRRALLIILDA